MQVQVNGEPKEISDHLTLAELVESLELPAQRIAVELNHVVVRRSAWATTDLQQDDRIEVVHFVGGGSDDFSDGRGWV